MTLFEAASLKGQLLEVDNKWMWISISFNCIIILFPLLFIYTQLSIDLIASLSTVIVASLSTTARVRSGHEEETPEAMRSRFVEYFGNKNIDGWLLRAGMQELQSKDNIPEPDIICAALHACRRVNDIALAVRFLEAVQVSPLSNFSPSSDRSANQNSHDCRQHQY